MSGVFTSVWILTVSCFGQFCDIPASQTIILPTPEACTSAQNAIVNSSSYHQQITTTCHGEAREVASPLRTN